MCITYAQEYLVMKYISGNLILRYLMHQCSDSEERQLNQWLGESPQNQSTFNYLKLVVNRMN